MTSQASHQTNLCNDNCSQIHADQNVLVWRAFYDSFMRKIVSPALVCSCNEPLHRFLTSRICLQAFHLFFEDYTIVNSRRSRCQRMSDPGIPWDSTCSFIIPVIQRLPGTLGKTEPISMGMRTTGVLRGEEGPPKYNSQ